MKVIELIENMLSKKAKYGLKALLALAERFEQGPVLISELAESEGIPKKFLELILLDLKNDGILQSKKGKGGGYYLAKRPNSVSLGSVIRVLDGPIGLLPCVNDAAHAPCDECEDEYTCGIRLVMKEVHDVMGEVLDRTTLADVLERSASAERHGLAALAYCI